MTETTENKHEKIEDWILDHIPYDDKTVFPIIKGNVNGAPVKTDTVVWLDLEENIAMTMKKIYALGTANEVWKKFLKSKGYELKDIEIKGVMH